MCIACREFIKDTLTVKEFKSALREVARDDEEHLREVEQALRRSAEDPEKLRRALSARAAD
jgi:hypothetical protein